MTDPRVNLRNPLLAGLLTFLIPGLGQVYQRRFFKGSLYFICILGTFFFGMFLGDWRVVAATVAAPEGGVPQKSKRFAITYAAQLGAGVVALPALLQSKRFYSDENVGSFRINEPMSDVPFVGSLFINGTEPQMVPVRGTISLEPTNDFENPVIGTFTGTTSDGKAISHELGRKFSIAPPVLADPLRGLIIGLADEEATELQGAIPRPLPDWFQVPLTEPIQGQLIRELGPQYDLAQVITWIAGLLNIFAIWDAIEGPAYGYGDESSKKEDEDDTTDRAAEPVAASEPTA